MTEEEVEKRARILWEQRDALIDKYLHIKPMSWDDATEPGKELMRDYARAGMTDWLPQRKTPPGG